MYIFATEGGVEFGKTALIISVNSLQHEISFSATHDALLKSACHESRRRSDISDDRYAIEMVHEKVAHCQYLASLKARDVFTRYDQSATAREGDRAIKSSSHIVDICL